MARTHVVAPKSQKGFPRLTALCTEVGSDTQKPFEIVIVTGLISRLLLGCFVNLVLYEMVAKEGDVLQV
jgi:heavy metal efflux system protein